MSTLTRAPQGFLAYLMVLVLGAIYPLGFSPIEWWPLPIISVAGFWWLLQGQSSRQGFWLGFFFGIGFFSVGISWVYVSINTFGNAPPLLASILTGCFVAILSLFTAFVGWFYNKFLDNLLLLNKVLGFALIWLIIDIMRGSGFVSFPWLYLGYSQTTGPFSGVASILGVHGLSLYMVLLSVLLAELVLKPGNKIFPSISFSLLLVVGVVLSIFGFKGDIKKNTPLTVALIQPNTDQHKKWDRQYFPEIVDGLIKQSENYWGADLMVWPEAAIPAYDTQVVELLQNLSSKASNSGSQLITGIPIFEQGKSAQDDSEYFAGIKMLGQQSASYKKQQLVPFGEYVPLQSVLRGLIDFFDLPMSGFTAGSAEQSLLEVEKAFLIPAICYEIAFSGLIQEMGSKVHNTNKPKVILTISNDTWFGKSWGPIQHFQMAKMRAIENGIPVIRATNNGLTALVDHSGNVIKEVPRFEKQVLAGAISLDSRKTFFAQYGYFSLMIIMGVILVIIIFTQLSKDFFSRRLFIKKFS